VLWSGLARGGRREEERLEMAAKLLVLCDGVPTWSGQAWVARDREGAAQLLERGQVRAVCIDRVDVDAALSDARWLRRRGNALPVLALLACEALSRAVELLAAGVQELVVRGTDAAETVERRLLFLERPAPDAVVAAEPRVVARSPGMRRVLELAGKAQRCDATVLIQGETGSGKEVVARLIHEGGTRQRGPFVGINCAAFPDTLLESEMFGHVRGAFTGAERSKAGLFEASRGGTLFLDEVGETSLAFQVRLLRALQEGVVRPLGSTREVRVDARIIAATNRDLLAEVELGNFRRDLFYRLHVFPIDVPPLRSRPEDVAALAEQFLARARGPLQRVGADAAALLEAYAWPGNVRELENEVARILAHACGESEISARMLSPRIQGGALPAACSGGETLRAMLARTERWILQRSLERHQGRRIAAARSLGITRECLYKKLLRHGLQ
jgi:DNA-binding NtrC family response regulator